MISMFLFPGIGSLGQLSPSSMTTTSFSRRIGERERRKTISEWLPANNEKRALKPSNLFMGNKKIPV